VIKAGIDIGAKNIKIVIMKDSEILAKGVFLSGIDIKVFINEIFNKVLKDANLSKENISQIIVTGVGTDLIPFATNKISIVSAIAKTANFYFPESKMVIDVGAEETRIVKCNKGAVLDFALNDKCAAGAGLFLEAISRALEVSLEEMGRLSLKTENTVPINTQCVIFAESEVVSLIHRKTPKGDIARSVYDSMASRVYSLASKLGIEQNTVVVGGVAKDIGFLDSLKRKLGVNLLVPDNPEFAGAIGACL
jgi:benzoyl-CoA reductase subunit D